MTPPAGRTWRMPAAWAPHERTWMAWPSGGSTPGGTEAEAALVRSAWAETARAVAAFEPVTVVVESADLHLARELLQDDTAWPIDLLIGDLDDAWMRDLGPTFVLGPGGELGAVDRASDGRGQQSWGVGRDDARIAALVSDAAGAHHLDSPLVADGGGLHVDGAGTALLTESVHLDPRRNPGWTKGDVEAELARTLGVSTCLWLPGRPTRDDSELNAHGRVDLLACFSGPGQVLLHWQGERHPDHAVSATTERLLSGATDAAGRPLQVTRLPAPATLEDDTGPPARSYLDHYPVNGGVIVATFEDEHDEQALAVLAAAYPDREIVTVDARPLVARGGGVHRMTQPQPAAAERSS